MDFSNWKTLLETNDKTLINELNEAPSVEVGEFLDEIDNDLTGNSAEFAPSSFSFLAHRTTAFGFLSRKTRNAAPITSSTMMP